MTFVLAAPSFGIPPPLVIQEKNLAAAEILIGQVEEIGPAPAAGQGQPPGGEGRPRVFHLRVWQVVKSQSRVQVGERREVFFLQEDEGGRSLKRERIGVLPVRVAVGDLVIVYANPREVEGRPLLLPVWGGLSVVRLTPPPAAGAAIRR